MDNQKKTISELTPDQMDKVSGGATDERRLYCCADCGYEFISDNVTLCCPCCGSDYIKPVHIQHGG